MIPGFLALAVLSSSESHPGMTAIAAHYRQQDQQRIADLHQQADSEHWCGQVFERVEVE